MKVVILIALIVVPGQAVKEFYRQMPLGWKKPQCEQLVKAMRRVGIAVVKYECIDGSMK